MNELLIPFMCFWMRCPALKLHLLCLGELAEEAMSAKTYADALRILSSLPVVSSNYFILAGADQGQGDVKTVICNQYIYTYISTICLRNISQVACARWVAATYRSWNYHVAPISHLGGLGKMCFQHFRSHRDTFWQHVISGCASGTWFH